MHIALDAREAFRTQKTGKGQWASGLITELRSKGIRLTLLTDASSGDADAVTFPAGIRWHFAAANYLRTARTIDCYISSTSFIVPFLLGGSLPCIPVIHDLIAFRGEPHDRKAMLIERLLLPRLPCRVAHFFAVSQSTKQDFLHRFPEVTEDRVTVVYAGPQQSSGAHYQPDGTTVLCIATLCPRKNQLKLMQAFAALPSPLRERYRLVLAGGRGWQDSEIVRMAQNTKGIEWIGYVTEDAYRQLLSTCVAFALPSFYEGFGMQVLDALHLGVPVLTSDRGSLKEVAGTAAVLVDPDSERSIESGLVAILEHDDVRRELTVRGPLQAAKFSWKRTADLVLKTVEAVVYSGHAKL